MKWGSEKTFLIGSTLSDAEYIRVVPHITDGKIDSVQMVHKACRTDTVPRLMAMAEEFVGKEEIEWDGSRGAFDNVGHSDHGMIMTDRHLDYSTMTEIGRLTISYEAGEIKVHSEGFEFSDAVSCRQASSRALAWARDVLNMGLQRDKLAPGSDLLIGVD